MTGLRAKRPIKFTTVNRLAELKWARAGWIIPPVDCEEHVTALVNGAFDRLTEAIDEDGVKARPSLIRLLNHNKSRSRLVILTCIKEISPSSRSRKGLRLDAAATKVSRAMKAMFRDLHSALALGKVTDSASQAPVVLLLTITEQQIADGVAAYMSEWE